MVQQVHGLSAATVATNLLRVRERIDRAGRDPGEVEILAAVKYLPEDALSALAEGGVRVVGENRAQALVAKQAAADAAGIGFTWDFIGQLQSRKVRDLAGRVRCIHSVASHSALEQLARHAWPELQIMLEVNVAGEASKSGIAVQELAAYLERSAAAGLHVAGLMTMPPLAERPEANRRHFATLAALAADHGLRELSMGTSQDFPIAAAEGATIVRLGTILYHGAP
jgi:pyridoxal phosphate enzyme (YggS family)